MMSDQDRIDTPVPDSSTVAARPDPPDRTLWSIIVLAVLALAGTLSLLPSFEEKAGGLLADGRYADAIELLVSVGDERPLDAYENYMLFKLYMLARQPDEAATLLELEPALQADNTWARRQLSALYRDVRDIKGETLTLRPLYDAMPTDADFVRLRALYRLLGDGAGEASLLAQVIAAGQTQQSNIDRLAYLQASSHSARQVAVWVAPASNYQALASHTAPPLPKVSISPITSLD